VKITEFSVHGFKNFQTRVVLDHLGPINLIHGPNNVGKSNLLQAMALFFRCLDNGDDDIPISFSRPVSADNLKELDLHPRDIFNLDKPIPVNLVAQIAIDREELERAGVRELFPSTMLDIAVELTWQGNSNVHFQIVRFQFADGTDATQQAETPDEKTRLLRFARFLARNLVREGPSDRFAIVGVRRDLELDEVPRPGGSVPLALEMFDCRESLDAERRDRWLAFVEAMRSLKDLTGPGNFEVTYQRSESRARLVFDTPSSRVPLRLLGTGVQQVAALLGHILMRNASIVAIEEPELNLRWSLQEKLRVVLEQAVSTQQGRGLSQLFISSHSPAFEYGDKFILMNPSQQGPTVTRCPTDKVRDVLGHDPRHSNLPDDAAQAYVSTQGVVRIPEHIRSSLGLQGGGGVVFHEEDGEVRLFSDARLLDQLGMNDDDEP
jgi:AAA domain, putative AbiEii toxin, Type IV TA system/AAA ATPase domain